MAYTDKARIQNYLLINIDDSFASQIDEWILVAQAYIDDYCGTSFEGTSEARYFDGDGTRELLVDDFVSLTKIEILDESGNVDHTLDATTDYYLYPANKTRKNRIVINRSNADISIFPCTYPQNIKITANWGFSNTVPADIQFAATNLVAVIIKVGNYVIGNEIKSERLGEYQITYQDIDKMVNDNVMGTKDILDRHRRIEV